MRTYDLDTNFDTFDHGDDRLAFRIGGIGGGLPTQRGGSAFDGTGHAPSGPGNANVAEHDSSRNKTRGPKTEGPVIRRNPGGHATGPGAKARAEAEAQARHGAEMMGHKPSGGLRPV